MPLTDAKPSTAPSASKSLPLPAGTAVSTLSPGALRSTAALSLEKNVGRSSPASAATVRTCGSAAGNSAGLPWSNSLPDAATGTMPARTARWIASASVVQRCVEP